MAAYLLDSNAFLWIKAVPEQISRETLEKLADRSNRVYVSVVALWELAIKAAMGRLDIFDRIAGRNPATLSEALREAGFDLLSIEISHVLRAARLPPHHRNPFDRMMIAQAQEGQLEIVTRDAVFARYDVRVLRV